MYQLFTSSMKAFESRRITFNLSQLGVGKAGLPALHMVYNIPRL